MKFFLTIVALGFLCACSDKDEDTGLDTAGTADTIDSGNSDSE